MNQTLESDPDRKTVNTTVYGVFEGKTVELLLVEDDKLFAELLASQMKFSKLANFSVEVVRTLKETLEQLATGRFEAVLLDLNLPDSVGLDTLRKVHGEFPYVPIVILTGMDSHDAARQAIEEGAQDYLVKGVDKSMDRSLLYALERSRNLKDLLNSQRTLREAQMRLIQADKLESIGRMAAGVAHEVKNPLAILRMGLEYLNNTLDVPADSDLAMITSDMDEAVTRAQTIINGMLDFSLPTNLELKVENLREVTDQAVRMVSHEMQTRNITLTLDFPVNVPEMRMDRRKIQQVLVNLILNAVHSIDENGEVRIEVESKVLNQVGNGVGRRESDTFKLGETLVTMRIMDSGKGIPQEHLKKLFDPFFTSKPVGQGTGLGLPISKNIIELHGGRIDIKNRDIGGVVASIMLVA